VLSDILPKLEKVKQNGERWWACCPVHNDKNPSMTLKEEDGKVLIHCFSCQANGQEVVAKLGLPASVLFRESKRQEIPQKVIEAAKEDAYFIAIFESEKQKGNRITHNDFKRYKLAKERIKLLKTG
jgi:hypothetical protein